jgi:diguanylate cyclase (GGDEF)-like protein
MTTMAFDILTLHLVLTIHLFLAAALLPLLMGRRPGNAARWAQASMAAQALGWALMIVSSRGFERVLSSLAVAGMACSLYLMQRALAQWLGQRPLQGLMKLACVAGPLVYAIGFDSYAFRVAWANGWIALQMLILCLATLGSERPAGKAWRLLICVCMAALAMVTAWRGVLGGFYTELYPAFDAPHPVNIASALLLNVTLVLVTVALLVAWHEEAEAKLQELAITDGLTGLLNRRAWQERAAALFADAQRHGHGLVLLMIDLDHFKLINDRLGHDAGDQALQVVARVLKATVRSADLVGRYGGEEFCVLLTHTDATSALAYDQRLRKALAAAVQAELEAPLSYSVGLAAARHPDTTVTALLKRADEALYAAKQAGRNRLEIARE